MKVLTIDRATWGRGRNNPEGSSYLFNADTTQLCCLGFYALQHGGAAPDEIEHESSPTEVPELIWGEALLARDREHTHLCIDLMRYNDDRLLSEPEREQKITELFASMDVQVVFVDSERAEGVAIEDRTP